ncbi:sec-independent protein translocase protein TatA [Faunimonas pinastri]|uniref:Sec-independent protein translocase protein TatA n=1 Tax=Faunimonas pinastri TaxID=1855383 RepID=A0A1H9FFZ3_9HYPH|nr:sec-independent protein translocase protein TatA [Faunimonas pinastri]
MEIGIWKLVITAAVVVLLFGRGKISDLMGDVAKGIKSFKQGMADDETTPAPRIEQTATPVAPEAFEKKQTVA